MTEKTKELIRQINELKAAGKGMTEISKTLGLSRQYLYMLLDYEKYRDNYHKEQHKRYVDRDTAREYHRNWRANNPDYYHAWYKNHRKSTKEYRGSLSNEH